MSYKENRRHDDAIIPPEILSNGESAAIPTKAAAQKASVSTATIRNWIKTGYLKKDENGLVLLDSLDIFLKEIAGNEKLHSRANKSQKDAHDHEQLQKTILARLSNDPLFSDAAGPEYEKGLADSYRNKEGVYYTPPHIVADMLPDTINNISEKRFCDPSCGSGNFIMQALEIGFKPENIFGFDIDPIAVEITKMRIYNKTGYRSKNIIKADFLDHAINNPVQYDWIFTNPPWGKKIPTNERNRYSSLFKTGTSTDTSAVFLFASLHCLAKNGTLGLLLPEAFFNIASFAEARKKALSLRIERLCDYGKPFKGLLSRASALILTAVNKQPYTINCHAGKSCFQRTSASFQRMPKSIINFHCDDDAAKIIEHLYSLPHIRLADNASWGLGIVTGNNKRFSRTSLAAGLMPVYRGSDITYQGLKPPRLFIPKDLSLYQQVAPVTLYEAPEKIIYKFISSKLCFFHDTKQRYVLNSANLLIPDKDFPITCKQLTALLNSDFMNWLFIKIFNTHKILRGDLEELPIHIKYFEKNPEFNEKSYLDFLGIAVTPNRNYKIIK